MKKLIIAFALSVVATLVAPTNALAQSSGNFAASIQKTQCTINTVGGLPNSGGLNNNGGGTLLETYIQTPNSKFTTLLIAPSLVTGLFTNTAVTTSMPTSANSAAVVVKVTLDGKPVLPATSDSPGVIYDQRFQQLSTNIFDKIDNCQGADPECNIDLVLSTLSAHSFNFIAPNVGGGVHSLKVEWEFVCTDSNGNPAPCTQTYTVNTAGACAGPGTVTVQQVKAFTQSGGIVVQ